MFCPTCGRDNSLERKYCVSCGTNLEAVSQALSGSEDNFFTRIDSGLDHHAAEQRVAKSWQVLGQSVLTSIINLLLFVLMWNVIPLRFLLLLISTPVRLILQRGEASKRTIPAGSGVPELPEAEPQQWIAGSIGSVTEHTTAMLGKQRPKTRA
jgi:hypothetical protein